jgi:TonB family protein
VSRLIVSRMLSYLLLAGSLLLSAPPAMSQEKEAESDCKVVSRVVPAYPALARKMSIQGKVRILAVVTPSGKVKSSKILGGNPVLAKAAEDAVGRWKFAVGNEETKEVIELRFGSE